MDVVAAEGQSLDALPVRLFLGGTQAQAMASWLESVAGWQSVDGVVGTLVPPVLAVADVPGAPGSASDLPTLLLVTADDPPEDAAQAALDADAVVRWPVDREELAVTARQLALDEARPTPQPTIRVSGAAGGVGTTTVALAIAGLAAWRRRPTLLLTHGHVPLECVAHDLEPADLAGARIWDVAAEAPGVPDLRVLRLRRAIPDAPLGPCRARLVVRDVGTDADGDVLVARRDRAALDALQATAAAVVVVVDAGVVAARAVQAAAGGRPVVTVPWSARVARAGARGRVPADLPGRWLSALAPVLAGGSR